MNATVMAMFVLTAFNAGLFFFNLCRDRPGPALLSLAAGGLSLWAMIANWTY